MKNCNTLKKSSDSIDWIETTSRSNNCPELPVAEIIRVYEANSKYTLESFGSKKADLSIQKTDFDPTISRALCDADIAWFKEHPYRCFLLRPHFRGELVNGSLHNSGNMIFGIVLIRVKNSIYLKTVLPLDKTCLSKIGSDIGIAELLKEHYNLGELPDPTEGDNFIHDVLRETGAW